MMDIAADPYFKYNLSLAICASLTKHNKLEPRNVRITESHYLSRIRNLRKKKTTGENFSKEAIVVFKSSCSFLFFYFVRLYVLIAIVVLKYCLITFLLADILILKAIYKASANKMRWTMK